MHLAKFGMQGDIDQMMRHSVHYLQAFSIVVTGWQWLFQAAVAKEALTAGKGSENFYRGKLAATQYWFAAEVTRIPQLVELCRSGDDSYAAMKPESF